ncbi:hypothetical protein M878_45240 [Streptomyces roseochromogenus subsp. oscitans DS 12.976]|uniref:Uncharacterized protein n=1 Tax=Streptomyces roseochromogenus subsp. oscitans DS 12.976 TaxID=1352936 RepID=V6JFN4_STRRC|nr:hypothetical protein M878_45240 [Streptomyces roseochromogenus subsp. oscitans DS 12.976]
MNRLLAVRWPAVLAGRALPGGSSCTVGDR